jgi:putative hemolysin
MQSKIVRFFEGMQAAERALSELRAEGFEEGSVKLAACQDEAGPMASNFTVGNDPEVVGGEAYSRTFEPRRQRANYILTAHPDTAEQAALAATICARNGGTEDPAVQRPGAA